MDTVSLVAVERAALAEKVVLEEQVVPVVPVAPVAQEVLVGAALFPEREALAEKAELLVRAVRLVPMALQGPTALEPESAEEGNVRLSLL